MKLCPSPFRVCALFAGSSADRGAGFLLPKNMSEPKNITAARKVLRDFKEKQKAARLLRSPYDLMLERLQPTVAPCPFCGGAGLVWGAGKKGRMRWEVKCEGRFACVNPYLNDWSGDYAQTQSDLVELRAERLIQIWNKRAA